MMQTPAISPVAKPQSGASHAKASDDASSLPFGDMLNREIADRGAMDSAAAPTKSASNTAKTAQPAAPANDAPAAKDDATTQPSNDPASNAPVTQDAAAAEAGKGKTGDDKKDDVDAEDMLSAASNELIALVANMNQPRAVTTDGASITDAGMDTATDAKKDVALIAAVDTKNAAANTQVDTQVGDDTAALTALAQAQTDTQAAPAATTMDPDADFGKTLAAAGATEPAAVPLASGSSKSQPIVAPTTMERSLTMSVKPGESQLKAGTGTNGKHAANAASVEVEAKAEPSSDKKAATETLAAATPSVRSEAAATPVPDAIRAAKDTLPQHDAVPNPAVAALATPSAAALNQVQAAAQFVDNLAPRVGTQEWNQALGQKVIWMANGEQQSASLTLNPPDLGPLQVVLSVTNNHATANFTAAQPEVRQALESAMPKLREMLSDAGIQLGQANVSAGTPNQQNAFQSSSQQSSRHNGSGTSSGDMVDAPVRVGRVQAAKSGTGLVDTFA
jgi:flagellar hook-length control protein FliK